MKRKWLCYSIGLATAIMVSGCEKDKSDSCPVGTQLVVVDGSEICQFVDGSKAEKVDVSVIERKAFGGDKSSAKEKTKTTTDNLLLNGEYEIYTAGLDNVPDTVKQQVESDKYASLYTDQKAVSYGMNPPNVEQKLIDDSVIPSQDMASSDNNKEMKAETLTEVVDITVKSGDSILKILANNGVSTRFFYNMSKDNQSKLIDINVGEAIRIEKNEGELVSLTKKISTLETMTLQNDDGEYVMDIEKGVPILSTEVRHVVVNNSLYVDGKRAGLSDYTIMKIQKILGEKIDFVYEVQKGDSFSVMVERPMYEGKMVGTPKIIGINFDSKRHGDVYAFRYQRTDDKRVGYYNEKGHSVKTGFLRIPTDYSRISSNFAPARLHPVLGRTRPHKGTDFAAPTGTPIYAASDGRVVRSGWGTGWGKLVEISHGNGIKTRYAHMSRRAAKNGQYVKQGDTIGYVGMSGTATGPNLHYEFLKNGKQIDAMKVELPAADPLPKSQMANFKREIEQIKTALSTLDKESYVAYTKDKKNHG